ncbi:MAG: DUF6745 domain-containing protein [Microcystaceae cyanobacterium]
MLKMMSGGRVPKKSVKKSNVPNFQPISPNQARQLILEGRAWDGMKVLGHLDLSDSSNLYTLPNNLTCESLDISDCVKLTSLPTGLHVTHWIEIAGSGITELPKGHGFILHWRGIRVDDHHILTDNLNGQEILQVENVELRRILIERLGYDKLIEQVGGIIRHKDKDAGGERQLISIPFEDDEPLMMLKVICPSTGHLHILRVPPYLQTCHQAAAWVAGFDNPNDYNPIIEA